MIVPLCGALFIDIDRINLGRANRKQSTSVVLRHSRRPPKARCIRGALVSCAWASSAHLTTRRHRHKCLARQTCMLFCFLCACAVICFRIYGYKHVCGLLVLLGLQRPPPDHNTAAAARVKLARRVCYVCFLCARAFICFRINA